MCTADGAALGFASDERLARWGISNGGTGGGIRCPIPKCRQTATETGTSPKRASAAASDRADEHSTA